MHPAKPFHVDDRETLLAFIAAHPFVTIAAAVRGRPFVAQAPVIIRALGDGELALDFHLSRGNVLSPHIVQGFRAVVLATGPDAYLSPDWYESADQVPTWNYLSVEAEGLVAPLNDDELVTQLDDLSAQGEAHLLPKPPWTRHKMNPVRFEAMTRAIIGARLIVDRLEGTFKLSQNKGEADRTGVVKALGDHPIAGLMRGVDA
jgi:transcriptional regulator